MSGALSLIGVLHAGPAVEQAVLTLRDEVISPSRGRAAPLGGANLSSACTMLTAPPTSPRRPLVEVCPSPAPRTEGGAVHLQCAAPPCVVGSGQDEAFAPVGAHPFAPFGAAPPPGGVPPDGGVPPPFGAPDGGVPPPGASVGAPDGMVPPGPPCGAAQLVAGVELALGVDDELVVEQPANAATSATAVPLASSIRRGREITLERIRRGPSRSGSARSPCPASGAGGDAHAWRPRCRA